MPLLKSDYDSLFLLEQGGQSQIWLGIEKSSSRVLCLRQTNATEQELVQLTQFHSKIQHPGLLGFAGFGIDQGHWTVHPYVHGVNLNQAPQLSESQVITLALQWTQALVYLHKQGVLHRDLHPGNLMLNGQGQAILLDFGHSAEFAKGIVGRTQYLSPEHLQNELVPASDLFCLALCLLRALRANDPIKEESISTLPLQWSNLDLSELSPQWQSILGSCLALDPRDRPESAQELLEALSTLQVHEHELNWQSIQDKSDQIFAQRLSQSNLSLEAQQKHCMHWLQMSPNSEWPMNYLSELKLRALEEHSNSAQPIDPVPKIPLAKFLMFKALFLLVVTLLVWWIWPSAPQSHSMDSFTNKALDQKTHLRSVKTYDWVKLPDSLCHHWTLQGVPKSGKILLKSGSYELVCKDDNKTVKYLLQFDTQTGVKWSLLP